MLDFIKVSVFESKSRIEVYPTFLIKPSEDLMVRGSDFYACWLEDFNRWSTVETDLFEIIDNMLYEEADRQREKHPDIPVVAKLMQNSNSGSVDAWHKYVQKQLRDRYVNLDRHLTFADDVVERADYVSKRLPYSLSNGETPGYDTLMSTLYDDAERRKIEWGVGVVIAGDMHVVQKFFVLYGSAGTGKSTVLNIIEKLFEGYTTVFDARTLGSSSSAFPLSAFSNDPLVAIQHDGDLSHIEDNTKLNSLVSHEPMLTNIKFKSPYTTSYDAILFMGTNKPVKITDSKSGLIRRLIDVNPSGRKLKPEDYREALSKIPFELGSIATRCLNTYLDNPHLYDDYIPTSMLGATNDFYNFILDSYYTFSGQESMTLKQAWAMYKEYCTDANISYPYSQKAFKEELKSYYDDYEERSRVNGDLRVRNLYSGFKKTKFMDPEPYEEPNVEEQEDSLPDWLQFTCTESIFDEQFADFPAQVAVKDGERSRPKVKWVNNTVKLKDINTHEEHYMFPDANVITVDFDIRDESGNKNRDLNLREASKWPKTYGEYSKSGEGVHLEYLYKGDPNKLSALVSPNVEVKVHCNNVPLRRRLTYCNNEPISEISSGLPLKEDKMVVSKVLSNERAIRTVVYKNLHKEYHAFTKPSMDFIKKVLDDSYENGIEYDISDMEPAIISFAAKSSNNSEYCLSLIPKLKLKSKQSEQDKLSTVEYDGDSLYFFDCEVYPNLFIICYKKKDEEGEEPNKVLTMVNPTPEEVADLAKLKLIGFNCRRYDNHICYGRMLGYSNEGLFDLSQSIVDRKQTNKPFFREAYNFSYTDIYDFASGPNKKGLKKFEIELGIDHMEMEIPWDKPVPDELVDKVVEYCCNDVVATEKVFNHLRGDWIAREILADISGGTVNDTTNSLTAKLIFGDNRNPTGFRYRNLADPIKDLPDDVYQFLMESKPKMMNHKFNDSQLPYFKGYKYEAGISTYKGNVTGEGGRAVSTPGYYTDVALLDVESMHPNSIIAECLFGPEFTRRFVELVNTRIAIKHSDYSTARVLMNGIMGKYIDLIEQGTYSAKEVADALKTAINSVYGLTAAKFKNIFKDDRNVDNIVAKRGALFMIDLEAFVASLGFEVIHTKTDSVKIPNATKEVIDKVIDFGNAYGYKFEHEATYKRLCIVDKANYIALHEAADNCMARYGYIPGDNKKNGNEWTATGDLFKRPYIFKELFSKEPMSIEDYQIVNQVDGSAMFLDFNENNPEEHDYKFVGRVGSFCPVIDGSGGGVLVRNNTSASAKSEYSSVNGAKNYRWLETAIVKGCDERVLNLDYYREEVDKVISKIEQFVPLVELVS